MEKKIFNLTQHQATPEQTAQGVIEPDEDTKRYISQYLTFEALPDKGLMENRAERLAGVVESYGNFDKALIGGAPYFMSTLEKVLRRHGITPVYAFSKRVVRETRQGDTTVKTVIFKHLGFIEV